ncbi:MAG: hypothetical protein KBT06_02220 [Prevotellaceae bacterium]|nr:hypothetical protein [Candidatus Colivivens equi]
MKKLFGTLLSLAVVLFTFTSCEIDDDVNTSTYLSGEWTGNWGVYYNYTYRGKVYTFDSYYSDIVFYPDYDYARHGYGKEVDFYNQGPYTKIYNYFYWEIRNGIIYLDYPDMPEYNTAIYDYRMSNSYFTGHFENSDFGEPFKLRKIADYYNWSYYNGYHSYYDRYNWYDDYYYYYYSKTRSAISDSTATDSIQPSEGTITGGGRHKINADN